MSPSPDMFIKGQQVAYRDGLADERLRWVAQVRLLIDRAEPDELTAIGVLTLLLERMGVVD